MPIVIEEWWLELRLGYEIIRIYKFYGRYIVYEEISNFVRLFKFLWACAL